MLIHQINSTKCSLTYIALGIFQALSEIIAKTISSNTDTKVIWASSAHQLISGLNSGGTFLPWNTVQH